MKPSPALLVPHVLLPHRHELVGVLYSSARPRSAREQTFLVSASEGSAVPNCLVRRAIALSLSRTATKLSLSLLPPEPPDSSSCLRSRDEAAMAGSQGAPGCAGRQFARTSMCGESPPTPALWGCLERQSFLSWRRRDRRASRGERGCRNATRSTFLFGMPCCVFPLGSLVSVGSLPSLYLRHRDGRVELIAESERPAIPRGGLMRCRTR